MRANQITKHFTNLAVLAGLAVLGSPAVYGGPGEGTLYGTDGTSMNLVTVDPGTGLNLTSISTGINFQALAVNPADGVIFAGTGGVVADVYTVTPGGAVTFVGAAGSGAVAITAMDFDDNGVLYAVLDLFDDLSLLDNDGDTLATIDTATGVATIVGSLGIDGFQSIAFAPDGTLYGMRLDDVFLYDSYLHVIDPSDGSVGLEVPITDFLGLPVDGGITGLQFNCDGTLYAGTAFDDFFLSGGGNLGRVGPLNTPVYAQIGVGPAVASFEGDLAALAFADSCTPPPPPVLEVVVDLEAGPNATPIRCGQSDRDLVTAVLSSDGTDTPVFDATTIDADTVRFGRDGSATLASEKHQQLGGATRHEQDVNGDGLTDLVFHFRLGATDFSCADLGGANSALIPATISGQLAGGEEFEGSGEFEMRK
ncbi:MAG: hypothetical protein O2968_05715 [Acidobacteria bacterium]|nr:hypothetical protein [Acidobacteriota bacterium]